MDARTQEEAAANATRLTELEAYYARLLRLPELHERSSLADLLPWLSTHGEAAVVEVQLPSHMRNQQMHMLPAPSPLALVQ